MNPHHAKKHSAKSLFPFLALPMLLGSSFAVGCADSSEDAVEPSPATEAGQTVVEPGDSGAGVEKAYRYLHQYGYLGDEKLPGNPQVFDDRLRDALLMYQEIHGLPADGTLNKQTAAAMAKPRCAEPDHNLVKKYQEDGPSASYSVNWQWPKRHLTYQHANYTNDLTQLFIQSSVAAAFTTWGNANPVLTFASQPSGGDIEMLFSFGSHGDGQSFDGPGGVLSHAIGPSAGGVHFDDDELWTTNGVGGVHFPAVATHEIGHVLGLGHSAVSGSVMNPVLGTQTTLGADDIQGIRDLYPPLAPNPLQVFNTACYGENQAQWAGQNGATRYELYRSTSPSFPSQVLVFSGNSTSETVTVPPGAFWYLRVRACTATNCGAYSNTDTASYFNGCP
jgi:Matrixin/Putative peptidoglycan binding domain